MGKNAIRISGGKGIDIRNNTFSGYEEPISIDNSEDVHIEKNKLLNVIHNQPLQIKVLEAIVVIATVIGTIFAVLQYFK